ncbi:MAG: MORN repeat-containing protein [Cyclobacteriaceae bacterium]
MTTKIILTGALAVAVGIAIWIFVKLNRSQKDLEALSHQVRLLQLKSEADNQFILGNLDVAMAHYQEYDSLASDTLMQFRIARHRNPAATSLSEQATEFTAQPQHQQHVLREYPNKKANSEANNAGSATDETRLLQNEIAELKQKLATLQDLQETASGKGILRFTSSKNGSVTYFGELAKGKANGEGFGYWKSGSSYEGTWKDNLRHGKGVFTWADGEKYEGEYLNDQRHGFGIYTAKAGRYEGQWLNDMRHGEGYLYEANGKLKVHGIWNNDKLIKTVK